MDGIKVAVEASEMIDIMNNECFKIKGLLTKKVLVSK